MGNAAVEKLESWRQVLSRSMEEAADLASGLDRVQIQLRKIGVRLPALRAQIGPLQEKSDRAQRADCHIDCAVRSAVALAERLEQLQGLQGAIECGDPQQDIGGYLLAVLQLQEAIRGARRPKIQEQVPHGGESQESEEDFNAEAVGGNLSARLKEIAMNKLECEFRRLLSENGSISPNITGRNSVKKKKRKKKQQQEEQHLPLEIPAVQKLRSIVKRMNGFPGGLHRCVKIYQEERIRLVCESILVKNYSNRKNNNNNELEWSALEKSIMDWTGHIQLLIQGVFTGEMNLCSKVFCETIVDKEAVREILGRVAQPGMNTVLGFGESFVRHSHPRMEKLFKLLDMFEALQNVGDLVSQVLFQGSGDCCTAIRVRLRELQKLVVDSASKVFWGFKAQVANQAVNLHQPPPDAGVHKLCVYVVNFVSYILSDFYSPIMEQVLRIEESWRSRNTNNNTNSSSRLRNTNSSSNSSSQNLNNPLLEIAIVELIASLEKAVETQSKWYKEMIHQRIFLMNNAYYIYKGMSSLFKKKKNGFLAASSIDQQQSWLKDRRGRVQQAALSYQKDGWGRVLSQLSRQGLFLVAGAETARHILRQRLHSFAAALEETCDRHRRHVVIADPELREATRVAVVHNIVPAYRSYLQAYSALMEPHSLRLSPDRVEALLGDMFDSLIPLNMLNS